MAEVVITYHRADRAFANRLVQALAELKIRIRRRIDDRALAKQDPVLASEAAVILLWSKHSSVSERFVYLASLTAANGQLHLVCVDGAAVSPLLESVAAHDLTGWRADLRHAGFVSLSVDLAVRLGLRHIVDRAPVMSVIVKNRPRAIGAEADAPATPEPQVHRKADDNDVFEIMSPDGVRTRLANHIPLVIGAATLLAACAAFVILIHPEVASPTRSATDAAGPDAPHAGSLRSTQRATTRLPTVQPDGDDIGSMAGEPKGDLQRRDAMSDAGAQPRVARTPGRRAAATTKAPRPVTGPSRLSPTRLRQRLLAASNETQLFLLGPQLRDNVERARGAALRAVDVAERAMAQPSPPLLVTQMSSGGAYAGEWSNDAANGVGTSRDSDGTEYAGSWRDSQRHGRGVLIYANNARYEGEFANGEPTGRGVFWDPNGRRLADAALFVALTSAKAPQ